MKKRAVAFGFLFLILGVMILNSGIVSAGPVDDIQDFFSGIAELLNPVLQYIIGDSTGIENYDSSTVFFIKVLVLIIVFAIVWAVLNNVDFFSENTWVLVVLSVAVSILATRFVGSDALIAILLPYTTLGVAISAGLPFVIWFMIVNVSFSGLGHKVLRRVSWIFFAVIFIVLWFSRYNEGVEGIFVYPITAGVAFLMFLLDGTINGLFLTFQLEKAGVQNKEDLLTELQRKIDQADIDLVRGVITQAQRAKRIKVYKRRIAALNK